MPPARLASASLLVVVVVGAVSVLVVAVGGGWGAGDWGETSGVEVADEAEHCDARRWTIAGGCLGIAPPMLHNLGGGGKHAYAEAVRVNANHERGLVGREVERLGGARCNKRDNDGHEEHHHDTCCPTDVRHRHLPPLHPPPPRTRHMRRKTQSIRIPFTHPQMCQSLWHSHAAA